MSDMRSGEPKDPLGSATTRVIAPLLRERGWERVTPRNFGRAANGILQFIVLNKSAWGTDWFRVTYGTNATFFPFALLHGGERPERRDYHAPDLERALAEVAVVAEALREVALPKLERERTPLAHRAALLKPDTISHHALFEAGCCAAAAGRLLDATCDLEQAMKRYQEDYDDSRRSYSYGPDFREWTLEYKERAQRLLAGVGSRSHRMILEDWMQENLRHSPFRRLRAGLSLPDVS